jgi:hypothetical protein
LNDKQWNVMKAIILIVCLVFPFMPGSNNANSNSVTLLRYTDYFWFDTAGNYLQRQSTIAVETAITGYTASTDNPKTLREKGFNPSNCSGWPTPVPNDFDLPDVLLYSHP